jgi:hypothetical protein
VTPEKNSATEATSSVINTVLPENRENTPGPPDIIAVVVIDRHSASGLCQHLKMQG